MSTKLTMIIIKMSFVFVFGNEFNTQAFGIDFKCLLFGMTDRPLAGRKKVEGSSWTCGRAEVMSFSSSHK